MTRRTRLIVVVVAIVIVLGIVVVLGTMFMAEGGTGWHPNRKSAQAVRAYAVDRGLRVGMQKADVLKAFKTDVTKNPDDRVNEADATFNQWTRPCPGGTCSTGSGAGYFELETSDPPHGLEGFGTVWSVRTRFDARGRLVQHSVHVGDCCGP
jgi:hypothetical protein